MQIKDTHKLLALNTDDNPANLPPGDVTKAFNVRMGASSEQRGVGIAETLQSEIEVLIAPDSTLLYYGDAIGGSFQYSGFAEIAIGSQVWMKKNWDANYPGSKVMDNEESNRTVFGGLYTHNQAMSADFCPDGWRVPTEADIDILIAELLGAAVAGGHMKEVGDSHWTNPNTGADDSKGFRAVPGGKFDLLFSLLGNNCLLWLQDEGVPVAPVALNGSEITGTTFKANWLTTDGATGYYLDVSLSNVFASFVAGFNNLDVGNVLTYPITGLGVLTPYYYRVRAYNEVGASDNSNTQTITTLDGVIDVDGNVYTYVTIGTQQWLAENLKTTKYADGTPIPNLTLNADWIAEDGSAGHNGAFCWYNNDIANKDVYGALYNWYAVANAYILAPIGWRIPTFADLQTLITLLGGDMVAGGKMKEIGYDHWIGTPPFGTDEVGFKSVGNGLRNENLLGDFDNLKEFGTFWINEFMILEPAEYNVSVMAETHFGANDILPIYSQWYMGFGVRCVRDV